MVCVGVKRNGDVCGNMTQVNERFCGVHGGLSGRAARAIRGSTRRKKRLDRVDSLVDSFSKVSFTENIDCCICLDVDIADPAQFSCCKQSACSGCVKKWLNTSKSCPFCRSKLVV
jgi:Ring finger domain